MITEATKYDTRHGGPYDRGGADYYYGRGYEPHYYVGKTYQSDKVEKKNMTLEEIHAYSAGYNYAAKLGDRKEW